VFGFAKVRYRGLNKNTHRLLVTCALANLFIARRHLLRRSAAWTARNAPQPKTPTTACNHLPRRRLTNSLSPFSSRSALVQTFPSPDAAIPPSSDAEHQQVPGHRIPKPEIVPRLFTGRHDPFEEQNFSIFDNRLPAVPQWYDGSVILPDDEEIREDVCVAAGRNRLKGISANETAAIAKSAGIDGVPRSRLGPRQIKAAATRLRIRLQDLRHQRPLPLPTSTTVLNWPRSYASTAGRCRKGPSLAIVRSNSEPTCGSLARCS